jgi:hypothetical protein
MGGSQSSIKLPLGRNYLVSYCKQHSVKEYTTFLKSVDLSNILISDNLIGSVYEYKLRFMGYSYHFTRNLEVKPLNELLKSNKIKNIETKWRCYTVSLDNIKHFLSNFSVLVAGFIISKKFAKTIMDIDIPHKLSDIILIIGYTQTGILIKTNWIRKELEIPFEFICNIKEIWNMEVLDFEDKYLLEEV